MAPVQVQDKYDASQFQTAHGGKTKRGSFTVNSENQTRAKYPEYLPTWNPNDKYPPYKFMKFHDKGLLADSQDSTYSHLFANKSNSFTNKRLSPKLGSIIDGIQLSELSDLGKNELAKFVTERGVVAFKNQNFNSKGPEFAVDFMKYFGPLHIHPTSGSPENFPNMHITFRGASQQELDSVFKNSNNSISWHSDCSYSLNGLQLTLFSVLQLPESGGDTLFANCVEAYNRLSKEFAARLEGLHILHSSKEQFENQKKNGGILRRDFAEENIHPIIRINPLTKQKSLYLNKEFGRRIIELKQEESDYLLNFLYDHLEKSQDLQVRISWDEDTIVLWNNATTIHTPVVDFNEPVIRHAYRISVMGERPINDLKNLNDENYLKEKYEKLSI
ncbi:unnamed protein product [Candida verbasci]|uniref:TauD/TfdA-like domain-containing protein n=1 Tax=Candida verbasci TaxID=1227364 RepID=A0A9W4X8D7_9ASCO|nr:unnamed protein product [Candida verbasci]